MELKKIKTTQNTSDLGDKYKNKLNSLTNKYYYSRQIINLFTFQKKTWISNYVKTSIYAGWQQSKV